MIAKATARYIRISPRRLRDVIPLVKGKDVRLAVEILRNVNKRATVPLEKVIRSAVANAKQKGYEEDNLFISKIIANPGPILKRYRAASFGRAVMIRRRTSHIHVELEQRRKV